MAIVSLVHHRSVIEVYVRAKLIGMLCNLGDIASNSNRSLLFFQLRCQRSVFLSEARLGKSYGCYATKTLIKVGFKSLNFLRARSSWSKDKPPTLQCSVETSLCKQL